MFILYDLFLVLFLDVILINWLLLVCWNSWLVFCGFEFGVGWESCWWIFVWMMYMLSWLLLLKLSNVVFLYMMLGKKKFLIFFSLNLILSLILVVIFLKKDGVLEVVLVLWGCIVFFCWLCLFGFWVVLSFFLDVLLLYLVMYDIYYLRRRIMVFCEIFCDYFDCLLIVNIEIF